MITLNFDEVLKRIYNAKKGVEVRYGLGQGFEYCKQFADEAQGHATNAKASADKAEQTVAGIEQTKTDAVQEVQNAQTTATTAITQTKDAALTDIGNAKTGALQEVASSTEAAQTAATKAEASKQAAEKSKEAAAASASTATTKAGEASASAGAASTSRQAAEKAQKAAEDAAELAGTRAGTDKTLATENAPADAKATGDALEGKADKSTVQDERGNAIFYSKAEVEAKIKEAIAAALSERDERDHDVGSFYVSDNPTSPAQKYGGTWERIEGKFIMGASDAYPAGSTGGSATHAQTKEELYPHSHRLMQSGENAKMNTASMGRSGSVTSDHDEYAAFGDRVQLFNLYSFTIETVGGGQPMDILNPYYSMYIWRRVA